MNRINPNKLLLSKWTALQPERKERHFIVSKVIRGQDETVTACILEAIISKNIYEIDWHQLEDSAVWLMGWK
jgi:tryptophan-rich hypothetical protein